MTRIFLALAFRVLARYLESGKIAADFAAPKGGQVSEQPRCFNVWTVTRDGWTLDRKGASRNPNQALARACLWDALGVGACVLPAGSDPNAPETIPPDVVQPWHQVGRYVDQGVRN